MDKTAIALIVVSAVVLLLAVSASVIFILLKKKRKVGANSDRDERILESRERIFLNERTVGVLLALTHVPNEIEELKALQDKIKYLTPSTSEEVKKIDEQILSALNGIKEELSAGKPLSGTEGIRTALAERELYTA